MRILSISAIIVCLLLLVAECSFLVPFLIVKGLAFAGLAFFGRMFVNTLTDEELNERV